MDAIICLEMLHYDIIVWIQLIKQCLTAIGDVEASSRHWVISLELQLQYVAVGRQVGRNFGPREASKYCGPWLVPIFDSEEVVGRLQVKVIEGQVDSGASLGDNEPHTVEVVSIAFWVVRRQHRPHGSGEVGETGDCVIEGKYISNDSNKRKPGEAICFNSHWSHDNLHHATCHDRFSIDKVQYKTMSALYN